MLLTERVGRTKWVVASGKVRLVTTGPEPEMTSHDRFCILNTGEADAQVTVTFYWAELRPCRSRHLARPLRPCHSIRGQRLPPISPCSPRSARSVPPPVSRLKPDVRPVRATGVDAGGAGSDSRMTDHIGTTRWVIADGYIPNRSTGPEPEMTSHESAALLNTGDANANVSISLYFADRDPAGPYQLTVSARRTKHVRFNELQDPEPVPLGIEYAVLIESDVPIVAQHTRLDSRQAENGLLSTIAFPA